MGEKAFKSTNINGSNIVYLALANSIKAECELLTFIRPEVVIGLIYLFLMLKS